MLELAKFDLAWVASAARRWGGSGGRGFRYRNGGVKADWLGPVGLLSLDRRFARLASSGLSVGLTFRELTVLHLVAAGRADKEIAVELGIRRRTVSKHLENILRKMGADCRTEAGVRALREGLVG